MKKTNQDDYEFPPKALTDPLWKVYRKCQRTEIQAYRTCRLIELRNELVALYWPWAIRTAGIWAARYKKKYQPGEWDAVLSVVGQGLMRVVEKYDHRPTTTFRTYATNMIRRIIMRWPRRGSKMSQITFTNTENALDLFKRKIAGEPDRDAQAKEDHDCRRAAIMRAMRVLDNQQAKIIFLRFWEGKTLLEVGEKLSITRERVRQIELVAKNRLAIALRKKLDILK